MIRTGIVTVLFTDLVDSSRLLGRFGDDEADRIRRGHFRALRRLLDRFGGREVKSLGDGLMVVFPSAVSAVSCAIEMQCVTLVRNEKDPDHAVGVRIGIHAGEPIQVDDDYYGTVVVVAKRLCDLAGGGQIEVSDLVRSIIGPRGGFSFEAIGPVALKGIDPPVQAWEVDWHSAADEQTAPVEDEPERRHRTPLKRALTLLAVVAAVVSGVMLGAMLYGEDAPTRRLPSDFSRPSSRTTTDEPRPVWAIGSLAGVGVQEPGKQKMQRIVEAGDRLYAVGVNNQNAGIWVSKDGQHWSQVEDRALGGPGSQSAWGIVELDGLLVAVGVSEDEFGSDPAVWTSKDGRHWDRVDRAAPALDEPGWQAMHRVALAPQGLVAVGYEDPYGDGVWDAAVWLSRDGVHWQRVEHDEEVLGGPGHQEMRGIAAHRDRIVVVGKENVGTGAGAIVWVSGDGRRWERVSDDDLGNLAGEIDQAMSSVSWADDSFLAVGFESPRGDKDAAVWVSADGREWNRLPAVETVLGGPDDQEMWGVSATEGGWVAAGLNEAGGGSDAAVWLSEGLKWRRASGDEAVFGGDQEQVMKWVLEFDGLLVGAGWNEVDGNFDAATWYSRLDG